ncbi:oxygen-dependent protoporphyrinogen oxidase [Podospora bellae-mahoneyi]|uniref:Protoporphyrinogen oxidase n=1 Tax=Podospora bellae-mahoneyi TaxID=2093777 RepID=A0ABR0FWQ2_9PEZI|nr:oxygen-dependent protoporphyrinogen oxidase [Podospora bellae-mahoneyi]
MLATSQRCLARSQRLITSSHLSSSLRSSSPPRYSRLLSTTSVWRQSNHDDVDGLPTIFDRPPASVAVLGGGLTGLATAFWLAWWHPQMKITIYEASNRLGGWIDSEEVKVKGLTGEKGSVWFQRGARMVNPQHSKGPLYRYDDLAFYLLVTQLGLSEQLQNAPETEVMGKYIYYPDHLVQLPNKSMTLLEVWQTLRKEPLFEGLFPSLWSFGKTRLRQLFTSTLKPPTQDAHSKNELSVGEHFTKMFGRPDLVENVLSAVMHGIYGGDVWKLSVQRTPFWDVLKDGGYPRLPPAYTWLDTPDAELLNWIRRDACRELAEDHLTTSAHWFPSGLNELTDALVEFLKKRGNVTIRLGHRVTSMTYAAKADRVAIRTSKQSTPITYEKVISTLYAKTLADICSPGTLPSLEKSTATTIRVVNLWYPEPGLNHPHKGFGYLIPQSVPFQENRHFILGVMFDSDREWVPNPHRPGQYINRGKDTIRGTKLTVMMGGHYWDHLPPHEIPDEQTAIRYAKKAVARHLGFSRATNDTAVVSTKLCKDCIPQQLVGHRERMKAAHEELLAAFRGRVAVAGGSYQVPGVLPSIRAALDIARQIRGSFHWQDAPRAVETKSITVGDTGLWRFAAPVRSMVRVDKSEFTALRGHDRRLAIIRRKRAESEMEREE